MIKFFRHIRHSLINENRTKKYLLYAVGEIILVVIGILIALQINNWNENQQNEAKIISIFKDIQKDLLNDIKEINRFSELYFKDRDSLTLKIIKDEFTEDHYLNMENSKLMVIGTIDYPLVISEQSFLVLNENKNSIPDQYKSVVKDLNSLYIEDQHFLKQELEALKSNTYNFQEFLYNKPWYREMFYNDIISNNVISFYLSDAYKNKIMLFRDRLNSVHSYASRIKRKAIQNYLVLNEITNLSNTLPKIISDQKNGSLRMSESYIGIYKDSTNNQIEFIEQNNLLFWYDEDQIYFDNFLLSELKKDSLQAIMWNPTTLKFKRNTRGEIIGFLHYNDGEIVNEYIRADYD